MALEYWLRGDVPPGPIKAAVLTDMKRVAEILTKFKGEEAMMLGPQLREAEELAGFRVIDTFVGIAESLGCTVITSATAIINRLKELGFTRYEVMFPLEAVQRLVRGALNVRLLILAGHRYSYSWLLLNTIKHYRPEINTLTLDPYVQPNATWSTPSLPLQIWYKNLLQLLEALRPKAQGAVD